MEGKEAGSDRMMEELEDMIEDMIDDEDVDGPSAEVLLRQSTHKTVTAPQNTVKARFGP